MIFLLVTVPLIGVISVTTPQYRASALVLVKAQSPQIVNLAPVLSNPAPNPFSLQSDLESEIELIHSGRNLEAIFAQFQVADDPEFNPSLSPPPSWAMALARAAERLREARAALGLEVAPTNEKADDLTRSHDKFLDRLSVEGRGRSRAIEIGFTSADPTKAAAIANAVAEGYVDLTLRDQVEATRQALSSITERLEQLRIQLTAAETAVEEYRISNDLIEGEDGSITAQRVAELNSRLVVAESEHAAARARLARLLEAGPEAAPEVLGSETIQKLREQEALQQHRLAELSSVLGPRHPLLVDLNAALDDLREKLRLEIHKIITSVRTQVAAASSSEANLRTILAVAESQAGQRNLADVRLRELQRKAAADRTLYELFLGRVQEISQQIGLQQPHAQLVTRALPPTTPAMPTKALFGLGAVLLASVLAVTAVVVVELLSGGFKSLRNIERAFGLPTLAILPRVGRRLLHRQGSRGRLDDQPRSEFGAAVQGLRACLRALPSGESKVVLFASSVAGEGKTTIAVAFARLAARAGQKVVLVDGDLWNSGVRRLLGGPSPGLTDVLHGSYRVDEVVRRDERTQLWILPAGSSHSAPTDLLSHRSLRDVLVELKYRYDLVVVDSPPTLAVRDARILATHAQEVIYIVRWRRTPKHMVRMGLEFLAQSGAAVSGLVYSQVDPQLTSRYGFNYVGRGFR